jgi:tRNA(His) 5'-end guanylyltransferase
MGKPNSKDNLGDRMKKYEYITRTHLIPRMPVIIRLDGKAFHTFTRGFKKPFDELLISTMQETTKYLCKNIQGCVLGYTQSDEITLVLVDYKRLDTCAWFDYNIQKCCSVAASMATFAFNKIFREKRSEYVDAIMALQDADIEEDYLKATYRAMESGAMFDARCFNVPKEEVTNCVLWRQNDAVRNSIEMLGQAHFSHKELHKKSCEDIKQMLLSEKNISWYMLPLHQQRGSCCIRVEDEDYDGRKRWEIDDEIPIFKDECRAYIDDLIKFEEE